MMPLNDAISIQRATADDVPLILELIRHLAEYEKLSHEVVATEQLLREHLFGPHPMAEALIARMANTGVGYALYFHNFSTFLGVPGIYLEDLFVRPEYRGLGIGKSLLREIARVAVARKCGRVEWSVLNWNEPSIEFYKRLGANPKSEWTIYQLTGDAIDRLAHG